MALNPSVQRLASQPGFPDLHVTAFSLPPLPDDLKARFPSLELWTERFNDAHRLWEESLQSTIEKALQAQNPPP